MEALTLESLNEREAELRRIQDAATAELETIATVKRYMAKASEFMGASRNVQARQPTLFSAPLPIPLPVPPRVPVDNFPPIPAVRQTQNGRPTLSALIVQVLTESPDRVWLTANEVQERVADILGQTPPMSSISPKLTDLKNRGLIVRHEMRVALRARVERGDDLTM